MGNRWTSRKTRSGENKVGKEKRKEAQLIQRRKAWAELLGSGTATKQVGFVSTGSCCIFSGRRRIYFLTEGLMKRRLGEFFGNLISGERETRLLFSVY